MKQDWKKYTFEEVFNLQMGKTPDRKNTSYWEDGTNSWVAIGDMGDEAYIEETKEKITDQAVQETKIFKIPADTVIMSFKLSIGKVAITKKEIFSNEAIMAFVVKEGFEILPKFLYYYLKAYRWTGSNKAVMGMTLNKKTISSQIIELPPLATQTRIVHQLDLLTRLTTLKAQQLTHLHHLAHSTFHHLFGDPVENEKGWPVKKLGDLCIGKPTYGAGASAEPYEEGKPRYIRITDIDDDGNLNDNKVTATVEDESKYLLHDGDILFARSGATVGKTYLYKEKDGRAIYAGYLIRFVPDQSVILPEYLFAFTHMPEYKDWISRQQNAVAQPNINAKQYSELEIPVPPIHLQKTFAQQITRLHRLATTIHTTQTHLHHLLQTTLHHHFG